MTPENTHAESKITFVCCVESGWLEEQTIRMVESLRRWGGALADSPVFAINPRFGPPVSSATRAAFDRLGVQYISFSADNPYSWKAFLNKHYSMALAERLAKTEFVGWLDSDMLVLGEPTELLLADTEDFAACAPDRTIGTTGPGDPFEPFWHEVCQVVGLTLDDLPWIVTAQESIRIRLYWNSGVFVYRRATGFSQFHLDTTLKVMDAKISSASAGNYFTQHTLGLAMVKMGLRWRALPHSHNFTPPTLDAHRDPAGLQKLKEAKILHYHDSMWPPKWPQFMSMVEASHPDVAAWLSMKSPMANNAAVPYKVVSKALSRLRQRRAVEYTKGCRVV